MKCAALLPLSDPFLQAPARNPPPSSSPPWEVPVPGLCLFVAVTLCRTSTFRATPWCPFLLSPCPQGFFCQQCPCSVESKGSGSLSIPADPLGLLQESPSSFQRLRGPEAQVPQAEPFPSLGCVSAQCPTGLFRLGAPRSTEEDPPHKYSQKYKVLANSFVANEAKGQPCPKKAFAGDQAVTGEVSVLCLFPFLRTTT